jgi:hypothetical protein
VIVTLQDLADSSLVPQRLGICKGDFARMADYANPAQERLLYEAGEDGWWGCWAKLVFNVTRDKPYITTPPEFARLISMNVCRQAIRINNNWFETLEAGIGLRTACDGKRNCGAREAFDRGVFYTAYDLPNANQKLRAYITDARDIGKRLLFQNAKDANGNGIYSQDTRYNVIGTYLTFNQPFVTTDFVITQFGPVQKDQTFGDVILMGVDATTGVETFLARYTPDETSPSYRRYLLTGLPCGCCTDGQPETPAQVTCFGKYELRKLVRPTDQLLIGSVAAMLEACSAIRHEQMDDLSAKALAVPEWKNATRILNQQLDHYQGVQVNINVAPWGTAKLERQRIGALI